MNDQRRPDKEGYKTVRPSPHGFMAAERQVKDANPSDQSRHRHDPHEHNGVFQTRQNLGRVGNQVLNKSVHNGYR